MINILYKLISEWLNFAVIKIYSTITIIGEIIYNTVLFLFSRWEYLLYLYLSVLVCISICGIYWGGATGPNEGGTEPTGGTAPTGEIGQDGVVTTLPPLIPGPGSQPLFPPLAPEFPMFFGTFGGNPGGFPDDVPEGVFLGVESDRPFDPQGTYHTYLTNPFPTISELAAHRNNSIIWSELKFISQWTHSLRSSMNAYLEGNTQAFPVPDYVALTVSSEWTRELEYFTALNGRVGNNPLAKRLILYKVNAILQMRRDLKLMSYYPHISQAQRMEHFTRIFNYTDVILISLVLLSVSLGFIMAPSNINMADIPALSDTINEVVS